MEQQQHLELCLNRQVDNEWHHDWATNEGETVYAPSDASDDTLAWVHLLSAEKHGREDHWPACAAEHIFIKELRAAIRAINELAPRDGTLVLVVDNTAAAQVLRNFYSSNAVGRELAEEAYDCLRNRRCRLVVAGIAGIHNYADAKTRNLPWCDTRRRKSWETATAALEGHERQELNPNRRACQDEEQFLEDLAKLARDTKME